jgi:Glycosyltransferase WbsX
MVMRNFNGEAFNAGFRAQLRKARHAGAEFVFINAWNEWAEGAYMEPDEARGRFFLESVQRALAEVEASPS